MHGLKTRLCFVLCPPLVYKEAHFTDFRLKKQILLQRNIQSAVRRSSENLLFIFFINQIFGLLISTMDSALDRLDAATFLQIWQHFDKDGTKFRFLMHLLLVKYVAITFILPAEIGSILFDLNQQHFGKSLIFEPAKYLVMLVVIIRMHCYINFN